MAFHDVTASADLETRLTSGVLKVQEAVGLKLGDCINQVRCKVQMCPAISHVPKSLLTPLHLTPQFSQATVGVGIAMYFSWKLTLVFLAFTPFLIGAMGYFAYMLQV